MEIEKFEDLKQLDSFGKICDDEYEFWFDDGLVCVKVSPLKSVNKYFMNIFHSIDHCTGMIVDSMKDVLGRLKLVEKYAEIYYLYKGNYLNLSQYGSNNDPYWVSRKAGATIKPLGNKQYEIHFTSDNYEDMIGTPIEIAPHLEYAERAEEARRWLQSQRGFNEFISR